MTKKSEKSFGKFLFQLFLIVLASLIFFLSHPNPLVTKGIGILGFFIYLPVFILVYKSSFKNIFFIALLYGALSYGLYGYWLHNFHPLGLVIVVIFYSLIMLFVFLGLKVIENLFPVNFPFVQCLFLCVYEYLKTLGFTGFSYGGVAYTQWQNSYFIQICDLIGVFGLNLVVIFPSAWIFSFVLKNRKRKTLLNRVDFSYGQVNKSSNLSQYFEKQKALKSTDTKISFISALIWLFCMIFIYAYGFYDLNQKHDYKTVKVAAIQNNEDAQKYGINEYAKNIQSAMKLSDEALELYPDIDFVLWSETSVVPSIIYQYYKLVDARRFKVVSSLLNFIDSKDAIFVIGNAHETDNALGSKDRYNSAFVFVPGQNVLPPEPEIYSKMHLVPFIESFPYKDYFPNLYLKLLNGDTHMWEKGSEYKVFDHKGLKFSTPICFEDTFGEDCRKFVLNGARCFFNMSNDSWSLSVPCQYQHLAMSVFRSVENRVPTVRSTATGETCIINEHGIITTKADEFCRSYVVGDIPVIDRTFKLSFYSKHGDLAGKAECLLFLLILIIQIFNVIIDILKKR